MALRISRNIEGSLAQFIEAQLIVDGWKNITVYKGFARAYNTPAPVITVRCSDSDHPPFEIGSNATVRETLVFVDIFGSNEGNKLDLKDWLVEVLKNGVDYYAYTLTAGEVSSKVKDGKVNIITMKDSPIDFSTPKNELSINDRNRWLITLTVDIGKIET